MIELLAILGLLLSVFLVVRLVQESNRADEAEVANDILQAKVIARFGEIDDRLKVIINGSGRKGLAMRIRLAFAILMGESVYEAEKEMSPPKPTLKEELKAKLPELDLDAFASYPHIDPATEFRAKFDRLTGKR